MNYHFFFKRDCQYPGSIPAITSSIHVGIFSIFLNVSLWFPGKQCFDDNILFDWTDREVIWFLYIVTNHTEPHDVMISVLGSCELRSLSSHAKFSICCFSGKHAALRRNSKDWLTLNLDNMWRCKSTCLPVNNGFSELTLWKSN